MKKKDGFIAISLIYSFFLVFLAVLFSIALDYSQNRILLNDVKKETQSYLDELGEFNPIFIENKTYNVGDKITYAYETWQVLKDDGTSVTMILNRTLTSDEIGEALKDLEDRSSKIIPEDSVNFLTGNVQMCLDFNDTLNYTSTFLCGYGSPTNYRYYSYNNSVVENILNSWYANNSTLQKAQNVGYLVEQKFTDGLYNYNHTKLNVYDEFYIRLPLVGTNKNQSGHLINENAAEFIDEESIIRGLEGTKDIWYLGGETNNAESFIRISNDNTVSATEKRGIRPVIEVKKVLES